MSVSVASAALYTRLRSAVAVAVHVNDHVNDDDYEP
jgi:hypothetical protein